MIRVKHIVIYTQINAPDYIPTQPSFRISIEPSWKCPNNNKRMSSAGSAVHLSGVIGRRGGHLCLLILCERDYRCDTFGLGEEHLHKVWREVSRRKTREAQFESHKTRKWEFNSR